MKFINIYALLLLLCFCSACKRNQTDLHGLAVQSKNNAAVISQVPNSMVRNVKQATNGNILVASYKGVFEYDGKSFTNISNAIQPPSFWDVLEDRKGNLWFATKDSGVYCYNGKSFIHFTTRSGLANNRVGSIYEDRAGYIWFATSGGISRYDGKSFRNLTTKQGLPNNDVNKIIEDKAGKLWIGTRGEACFFDGNAFTVLKNKDGKAFNNVWSIIEDQKGSIWFGASVIEDKRGDTLFVSDGLWRFDGSNYTKASGRGAGAIIQDKKGNLWTTGIVNPPNGRVWALSRYDANSLYDKAPAVTEIMSINGIGMLCGILEARDGSIWFGAGVAEGGVYRYDGKTVTNFKNEACGK